MSGALDLPGAGSLTRPAPPASPLAGALDGLRRQWTRDLAWLLFSPGLLAPRYFADALAVADAGVAASRVHDWMTEWDLRSPPPGLDEALTPPRLGLWAERLVLHYLSGDCGPKLAAANVTVRDAGRTVGECDFLLYDAAGRALHWEMAVKFYLRVDGARGHSLSAYVGPGLSDRLDIKLDRLVRHQLRIVERAPAHTFPRGPWHSQILLKGWLFERLGAAHRSVPDALSPHHPRGFWATEDDWAARQPGTQWETFVVLPHHAWLSGLAQDLDRRLDSAGLSARVAAHFGKSDAPLLVAVMHWRDRAWREARRGFIVPRHWPEAARAFAAVRRP